MYPFSTYISHIHSYIHDSICPSTHQIHPFTHLPTIHIPTHLSTIHPSSKYLSPFLSTPALFQTSLWHKHQHHQVLLRQNLRGRIDSLAIGKRQDRLSVTVRSCKLDTCQGPPRRGRLRKYLHQIGPWEGTVHCGRHHPRQVVMGYSKKSG